MSNNNPTEQMSSFAVKNSEKNLKRRIAYKEMPARKRAALLQRRRTEYSGRRHHSLQNTPAVHLGYTAREPQNIIPPLPALFIADNFSTASSNEHSAQCNNIYEVGSTSATSNECSSFYQRRPVMKACVAAPIFSKGS